MELLQPVIRPYAWGSRHGIAGFRAARSRLTGPEAELWLGAHPSAPSGAAGTTLDAVIAADPDRELGPRCVARFGPRLPFLLKVLSAEQALSIQVHPSRAQAEIGFRAENERGLAPGDPARNYVDDWPKPELLCALTPFEVLAGLRTPRRRGRPPPRPRRHRPRSARRRARGRPEPRPSWPARWRPSWSGRTRASWSPAS